MRYKFKFIMNLIHLIWIGFFTNLICCQKDGEIKIDEYGNLVTFHAGEWGYIILNYFLEIYVSKISHKKQLT